ncbi:MAG: hypothetical protein LW850_34510 [Planctomycetaceae bacterium]|nr:hypothetical protein [Planctomycetaceae bacterium]
MSSHRSDNVSEELPRELDPLVDRRRSHPSSFELLVKLFRMPRSDLVDPDSLGHVLFEVRYYLFPYRNRLDQSLRRGVQHSRQDDERRAIATGPVSDRWPASSTDT